MFEVKIKKFINVNGIRWFFNIKKFKLFNGFEITLLGLMFSFKEKNFFNKINTISFCFDLQKK